MVKTPVFDPPTGFGAVSERLPIEIEKIRITPGAIVTIRYKGKAGSIRVTQVVRPQAEFEGEIEAFEDEPKHEDLTQGDVVRFAYGDIEHIYKWIEADQA